MNPQLNKVFSKLAKAENKTELASEKVELAGVKDLDKKLKEIFTNQKKLDKINPSIEKLLKDQKDAKNQLAMHIKESQTQLDNFEKQAKELGLSADGVPSFKSLKIEIANSKSEYLK